MRVGCDTARDAGELLRAVRAWLTDPLVVSQDAAAVEVRQALDEAGGALDRVREIARHEG